MARIVFLGTPEFALPSLESLLHNHKVVGVVTQPDRPAGRGRSLKRSAVKQKAEEANLPIYQPKNLRQEDAIEQLEKWDPEAIVVAAFGQILPEDVLELPPHGSINVHGSLLPRWRGASPIQHAILAGDKESGISLMEMEAGLDTGPVYIQESVEIGPRETAQELHDKLAALGGSMLADHLEDILSGKLIPVPQEDSMATYAPLVKKEAGLIDWSRSSLEIDRQVRAMTPWPGAFTSWKGMNLKILSARPLNGNGSTGSLPGQVEEVGGSTAISTGMGSLELVEVQLAGKRAAAVDDFLRGRPDFIGSRVGT